MYYDSYIDVINSDVVDLLDADLLKLSYIYDGIFYEMTYDFVNQSVTYHKLHKKAYQWGKQKMTRLVSKPKAEIIQVDYDEESMGVTVDKQE